MNKIWIAAGYALAMTMRGLETFAPRTIYAYSNRNLKHRHSRVGGNPVKVQFFCECLNSSQLTI